MLFDILVQQIIFNCILKIYCLSCNVSAISMALWKVESAIYRLYSLQAFSTCLTLQAINCLSSQIISLPAGCSLLTKWLPVSVISAKIFSKNGLYIFSDMFQATWVSKLQWLQKHHYCHYCNQVNNHVKIIKCIIIITIIMIISVKFKIIFSALLAGFFIKYLVDKFCLIRWSLPWWYWWWFFILVIHIHILDITDQVPNQDQKQNLLFQAGYPWWGACQWT